MRGLAVEDVLAPNHHGRRFLLIGGFLTGIASLMVLSSAICIGLGLC